VRASFFLQVAVVYKRPTDLALRADVPVVCNLLLADIMDEGGRRCTLFGSVRISMQKSKRIHAEKPRFLTTWLTFWDP